MVLTCAEYEFAWAALLLFTIKIVIKCNMLKGLKSTNGISGIFCLCSKLYTYSVTNGGSILKVSSMGR